MTRTPSIRGWTAAAAALLVALSCGGGAPVVTDVFGADIRRDVSAADVADAAGEDTPETTDEGVEASCRTVLSDWQCLEDADCPAWAVCAGRGSCEEPPCWGICDDYPGACLPRLDATTCSTDAECGDGRVCVFDGTAAGRPGLCRSRPSSDACWSDAHCAAGQECAGEVLCVPGNDCTGPDAWGLCVARPATGCLDDADCAASQACQGAALCPAGSGGCTASVPGQCVERAAPCKTDADCKGSTDGTFCTGATLCGGTGCVGGARAYCSPAPGFYGCWEDADCGTDSVCRASLACPPGSWCRQDGRAHPGQCGTPSLAGEEISAGVQDGEHATGDTFSALIRNDGASVAWFNACYTVLVEGMDEATGKWKPEIVSYFPHPAVCTAKTGNPRVALAPGGGLAIPMKFAIPGVYRLLVSFELGCVQGGTSASCRFKSGDLRSEPFEIE
jgi:hypothetical protein